jgi:raffinose/stachyose/melibiose transport system permease protein
VTSRLSREIWEKRTVYLFLLPAFIPIVIFGYIPAVEAFSLCFTNSRGAWVGFDNIVLIAQDKTFFKSVANMGIFVLAGLLSANIPAFFMAEMLYNIKSKQAGSVYRFLFIIPMMIPASVIYLVWQHLMLDPMSGLVNAFLNSFGISPLGWLGEINTALPSLILIGFPWMAGINLLILLAGLQNIPESVLESSTLDGANIITRIWKIDLPLIVGQFKLLIILGIINGIQAFQLPFMVTSPPGGPANSTMMPGLWMYLRAFQFSDFNYASVIGAVMFFAILFFSYLNIKLIKVDTE